MIGLGIGIGISSSRRMSPSAYATRKRAILGSKLRGLFLLGIDATLDEDDFVLTCPNRIAGGGTLARVRGDAQTVTVATENGKPCLSHTGPSIDDAALGLTTAWTPKSVLAVASTVDAIADTYNVLARGNPYANDSTWLVRYSGTANLYNSWGTKYINGVTGVAVSTAPRIYESEKADNTDTGIVIMGYQHVVGASWRGNAFELRLTDATLTAEERAAETSLTKAFWGV